MVEQPPLNHANSANLNWVTLSLTPSADGMLNFLLALLGSESQVEINMPVLGMMQITFPSMDVLLLPRIVH